MQQDSGCELMQRNRDNSGAIVGLLRGPIEGPSDAWRLQEYSEYSKVQSSAVVLAVCRTAR